MRLRLQNAVTIKLVVALTTSCRTLATNLAYATQNCDTLVVFPIGRGMHMYGVRRVMFQGVLPRVVLGFLNLLIVIFVVRQA